LEVLEDRTVLSPVVQPIAPIPSNDVQPTDGPTPLVLQTLSYFSEVDGATLLPGSVKISTPPTHGSAAIDPATGNITYTANSGFAGTDLIGFTVSDTNGLTAKPAFVNEVVTLPTANPDNIDTDAGNPVTIAVLANDSSQGAPLNPATVAVVGGPHHGSVAIDPKTGNITYTSVASYSGTDTFSYTVKDQNGVVSNAALVSVVVNRPQANDDFASTITGKAVVIAVLANDADPDGPNKLNLSSVAVVTGPAHGSVAVDSSTGNVTYTPNAGFSGSDSFTYTVTDVNNAVSNPATVTIAVQNQGGGVAINPVTIDTDAGNAVTIDVLAADTDPAGLNPATVSVTTPASDGGTSVDAATGRITYTPAAGFAGTDSFTYSVKDNNGAVAGSATVSVVVNRPKANDDFATTSAGNAVVIPVLANDTDPDGPNKLNASSVTITGGPSNGSILVDSTTGNVTYTPNFGFAGTDTFTYTVMDVNNAVSNTATVNVVVTKPQANDTFGTTDSGFPITINTLANATDAGGTLVPASTAIVTGPAHGTASIDPTTGNITYQSNIGFNGTDTLTFTVADNNNTVSNVATITIVVNRPTASPDAGTSNVNTPVLMNVAANDSDPDGNQFLNSSSVTITTPPSHGTVSVSGTGEVTYTPAFNFVGTDTFAYTIADAHGAVSNPATDTVTVQGPGAGLPVGPVLIALPAQPLPPAPAGLDRNTLFVTGLYRDLLGRQGDAAGVSAWVKSLQQGASRTAIAQAILNSSEHLTAVVSGYYETFFNRAPDEAGLTGWLSALQGGMSQQQVVLRMLTSQEFLAQHASVDSFVNALYADVLGRTGDIGSVVAWDLALGTGIISRAQAVLAFLNSTEAQQGIVDAYYAGFMGRAADNAGVTDWLSALEGQHLTFDGAAADFLASSEYAQALATGIR
jgi:hypothetical protein